MKELSIEEKATRYDEALEKSKRLYEQGTITESLCYVFPELAESEDERIRKSVIGFLKTISSLKDGKTVSNEDFDSTEILKWVAWFEKQGEKDEEILILKDQIESLHAAIIALKEVHKIELEKQGEKGTNGNEREIPNSEQMPADKVEPKFKVKYANSEYNVLKIKEIAGVTYYGIEDEPNHIDYVLPDNCEIINGYAIKENGCPYPTKPAVFSEQKPAETEKGVKRNDREIPFSEKEPYEGLTDFERTLADICIGWIGQELGWKQYIKDNADVLLKIAIKKLYSAQDVAFEQKPAELSHSEVTKTSDQVQKPAECRQETKPNGGIVYEDFNEGDGSYKVNLAYLSKPQVELIEDLVDSWQNTTNPYERCVQYQSVKDGIKSHAETYSFNIESELFNQLSKEQQGLWRKEIEQACISGGEVGVELAKDPRYKENHEVKEMNLEKYLKESIEDIFFDLDGVAVKGTTHYITVEDVKYIAKNFFELGLKAQKGEEV